MSWQNELGFTDPTPAAIADELDRLAMLLPTTATRRIHRLADALAIAVHHADKVKGYLPTQHAGDIFALCHDVAQATEGPTRSVEGAIRAAPGSVTYTRAGMQQPPSLARLAEPLRAWASRLRDRTVAPAEQTPPNLTPAERQAYAAMLQAVEDNPTLATATQAELYRYIESEGVAVDGEPYRPQSGDAWVKAYRRAKHKIAADKADK